MRWWQRLFGRRRGEAEMEEEVSPMQLGTLAGASSTMLVVGLLAAYLPARRASLLPATMALRHE